MVLDTYKPHISGVTNHVALNKVYMEAEGHEVYIFTFGGLKYQDDEPNVIRSAGLPVVDSGYYVNVRYNKEARKLLQTMDVVHVHHPFVSGTLALRYCKPYNIPVVATNHTRYDLYYQAYLPMLPERIGESFLHTYLPSFYRSCDLVITPSEGMREVMIDLGVDTFIDVVPNGVNLSPFHMAASLNLRPEFDYKEEDTILVYCGRIGPEKNLSFLLRSFRGIADTFDNVYLLIIGGGSEYESLVSKVQQMEGSEKIKLTGFVPYEEVPKYLSMGDIFVTSSVTEVHPLTVIEAMGTGLPVIGIQSPGISDTVVDGVSGFLSRNDLAAFTAKIARLVTDVELCKQFSEAALKESERYAIERTSEELLTRYRDLVDHTKNDHKGWRARISRFVKRVRK
jgi:glycosyltransferase involved in cell wall biosynthesis